MASTNGVLENESDNRTSNDIDRSRGRDGCVEYDGETTMPNLSIFALCDTEDLLDIANPGIGEFKADDIGKKRAEESNDAEGRKAVINLALRELALWADDTPNDTGGTEHFNMRTDKSIFL